VDGAAISAIAIVSAANNVGSDLNIASLLKNRVTQPIINTAPQATSPPALKIISVNRFIGNVAAVVERARIKEAEAYRMHYVNKKIEAVHFS
jgi:hypothetical protein